MFVYVCVCGGGGGGERGGERRYEELQPRVLRGYGWG